MEELKASVHAAAKGDLRAFEHLVLHFQDMAGVLGNGERSRSFLLVVNDLIFSIDCIGTISLFCLRVARSRQKTM